MIPYPDPIVVQILTALPVVADDFGGRASVVLADVLPAIRLTKVGDAEAPSDWEAAPLYQIEVWAADELEAGHLAWAVRNSWTTSKRQTVGDAVVHGRWVETDPRSFPDTDTKIVADTGTDYARYLFTVGVRLSGASSA